MTPLLCSQLAGQASGHGSTDDHQEVYLDDQQTLFIPVEVIKINGPDYEIPIEVTNQISHLNSPKISYLVFDELVGQEALLGDPLPDNGAIGNSSWLSGVTRLEKLAKGQTNKINVVLDIPAGVTDGSYGRAIVIHDEADQEIYRQLIVINIGLTKNKVEEIVLAAGQSGDQFNLAKKEFQVALVNQGVHQIPVVTAQAVFNLNQNSWSVDLKQNLKSNVFSLWPKTKTALKADLSRQPQWLLEAIRQKSFVKVELVVRLGASRQALIWPHSLTWQSSDDDQSATKGSFWRNSLLLITLLAAAIFVFLQFKRKHFLKFWSKISKKPASSKSGQQVKKPVVTVKAETIEQQRPTDSKEAAESDQEQPEEAASEIKFESEKTKNEAGQDDQKKDEQDNEGQPD